MKLLHVKALTQEQKDALQTFLGDLARHSTVQARPIDVTRDRALRG